MGDIKMINRRKRILVTFLSGIVLVMASGISSSYAQGSIEFAGTWNAVLIMNGHKEFTLRMVQRGDQVTGTFPGNGRIEGTISGRVLRFRWQSDSGGKGSGRFVMDEKQFAFNGTYNRGDNPDDVDNTWSGRRHASPEWLPGQRDPADKVPVRIPGKRLEGEPEPDPMGKMSEAEYVKKLAEYEERQKNAPATFAGVWLTKSGEKIQFPQILFQQTDNKVVGHLYAGRPDLGEFRDGVVERNTLRFTVWKFIPLPSGSWTNQYLGKGELVMDADGRSFRGTLLGGATSGTLVGR